MVNAVEFLSKEGIARGLLDEAAVCDGEEGPSAVDAGGGYRCGGFFENLGVFRDEALEDGLRGFGRGHWGTASGGGESIESICWDVVVVWILLRQVGRCRK